MLVAPLLDEETNHAIDDLDKSSSLREFVDQPRQRGAVAAVQLARWERLGALEL